MPVVTSRHQRRDRVLLLKVHAGRRQRVTGRLNIFEPDAYAGAAKLDREPDFAHLHAAGDVVGLHFFRATAFNAGRFMRHAGIGERAADDTRPVQFIRLKAGGRADIGLGVEAQAHHLEYLAHGSHHGGIQMLLAEPVVAGIALDAFVAVDGGALDLRIDIDRAHRAHIRAVSARDAFIWINCHTDSRENMAAGIDSRIQARPRPSTTREATKNGAFQPNHDRDSASRAGEIAAAYVTTTIHHRRYRPCVIAADVQRQGPGDAYGQFQPEYGQTVKRTQVNGSAVKVAGMMADRR